MTAIPHQCHICGINKMEKLSLLQHLRKCDDGRDSKCEECGKIFKGKMKLTSHKRVHQKIYCVECGMEMPVGSLNDHMKCHKMKPNQVLFCEKCPFETTKKSNFKKTSINLSKDKREGGCITLLQFVCF